MNIDQIEKVLFNRRSPSIMQRLMYYAHLYQGLLGDTAFKAPKKVYRRNICLKINDDLYVIDTRGQMYLESRKGRRKALGFYSWDKLTGVLYIDGNLKFIFIDNDKYTIQHERVVTESEAVKIIKNIKG